MVKYLNKFKNFIKNNETTSVVLIFLIWSIFIFSYIFLDGFINSGNLSNGFKLGGDSIFYINETKNLIEGNPIKLKSRLAFYFALMPFVYFNISLAWFVIFQTIITGLSGFFLYKITLKYFSRFSALICLLLFLFYIPIQIRNFYILTDILFINLSILITYFIFFYKNKFLPIIIILLISISLLRQNGILYFFSIIGAVLFYLNYNKKYFSILIYLLILAIFTFPIKELLSFLLNNSNLIDSIIDRGIIYGYSFKTKAVCYSNCNSLELLKTSSTSSLQDLFNFYKLNLINLSKLFFYKVFWLLVRVRPYYSDLHNLYILVYSIILYPSFVYGFLKRPKNNFAINVVLLFTFFQILLFGITFVDWSGRFSLYFLPFIMIFSSYGISNFLSILYKKLTI